MYGPGEFGQGRSGHRRYHEIEDVEDVTDIPEPHHFHQHHHVDGHEDTVKIGKKRQIVGILVSL